MRTFTRSLLALCTVAALSVSSPAAQSPVRGPLPRDDMPLADYLGLLAQIAPAAQEGAQTYLNAFQQRCGRAPGTAELRRAMSEGDGDPVLMGLIRAAHLRDTAARDSLVQQLRCPAGAAR
jgi:hypothetical protein